jgi:hypothetical protein
MTGFSISCDDFWAFVTKMLVCSYFFRWAAGYILRQSPISIPTVSPGFNYLFS